MDKAWKMLAIIGAGYGAWMLYKKCNPECVHNIKTTMNKLTKDASEKIENMM